MFKMFESVMRSITRRANRKNASSAIVSPYVSSTKEISSNAAVQDSVEKLLSSPHALHTGCKEITVHLDEAEQADMKVIAEQHGVSMEEIIHSGISLFALVNYETSTDGKILVLSGDKKIRELNSIPPSERGPRGKIINLSDHLKKAPEINLG